MLEFFQKLFKSDFMPHGFCYKWHPEILWLHLVVGCADCTVLLPDTGSVSST